MPPPKIENNENSAHIYASNSHLANITNNLNLNRQIGQSQLHRSSSAGSGGRGGEQGAKLPGGLMLPPIWPLSNERSDLFEAPTKIVNGDKSVENVLGSFEHADRLSKCIGVDYVPPAPGLIQTPQLLNPSMPKPPPGPKQNITVSHARQ